MFTEKTLIILGAGASCHLGYPIGEELITKIITYGKIQDSFSGHRELTTLLKEMQPLSIDTFLSYHREFEKIGKESIANIILNVEDANKTVPKNWYRFLVDAFISQCKTSQDILTNLENIMIATFNYDISLEHHLYSRLKKISFFDKHVDEFLENIKIIHIYGQLGCFSWHNKFCNEIYQNGIIERRNEHYGNKSTMNFVNLATGIDIIGIEKCNPQEPPEHIKLIHDFLKEAKNVYILGFGFYEENMELIHLNNSTFQDKNKTFYYTNLNNMQKVERKLLERNFDFNKERSYKFIKSNKKVYEALNEDFELF